MKSHNNEAGGGGQFSESLKSLESLVVVSEQLQKSLMTRDALQISAAVQQQDQIAAAMRQQLDVAAGGLDDSPEHRSEAKRLCGRLRRMQQSNKRLASSFLSAMNRALIQIRVPSGNDVGTYSAAGAVTVPCSPMFVSQQG
jgi:hypothetical protein